MTVRMMIATSIRLERPRAGPEHDRLLPPSKTRSSEKNTRQERVRSTSKRHLPSNMTGNTRAAGSREATSTAGLSPPITTRPTPSYGAQTAPVYKRSSSSGSATSVAVTKNPASTDTNVKIAKPPKSRRSAGVSPSSTLPTSSASTSSQRPPERPPSTAASSSSSTLQIFSVPCLEPATQPSKKNRQSVSAMIRRSSRSRYGAQNGKRIAARNIRQGAEDTVSLLHSITQPEESSKATVSFNDMRSMRQSESRPPSQSSAMRPDTNLVPNQTADGSWLSLLIPDNDPATAHARGHSGAPVDFSDDFLAYFDSHNDSDSIIWDPRSDLPNLFVPRQPRPQLRKQREVSEVGNTLSNCDAQKEAAKLSPPMQTVTVVCKASTTITTNSSSSSSSSVPGSLWPKPEARDDDDDDEHEDGVVSDKGDEDDANPIAIVDNRPKTKQVTIFTAENHMKAEQQDPKRPVHQPSSSPAPLPPVSCESSPPPRRHGRARQRQLSFSSLQMMLESRHGASGGDDERVPSREEKARRCHEVDNECDYDVMTVVSDEYGVNNHGDDTYSFIGNDYSFGADRSLVSWCA